MLERFRKRPQTQKRIEYYDSLSIPLGERSEQLVDKLLGDLKHGFRAEFTPGEEDEWIYGVEPPVMVDFIVGLKYNPNTYFTLHFDGDLNNAQDLNAIPFNKLSDIGLYNGVDKRIMYFSHRNFYYGDETYAPTLFHNTVNNIAHTKRAADEMMTQLYLAEVDAEATLVLFNKVKEDGGYDNVRWPRYKST